MPAHFCASRLTCPPKPAAERTPQGVFPLLEETPPLSLRNADNKILVGVMAAAAVPAQMAYVILEARGFVPGRQLLENTLDLCAYARVAG